MLQVTHLTKRFKSGDAIVSAVDDVSFKVPEGCFASIIGKSGSGKSTLLSMLGALDRPTEGSIKVDGTDITSLHGGRLTNYRLKRIGFVFQNYNLIPNLTALENVMLPLAFAHIPAKERRQKAEELLNSVGLTGDKQKRKPGKLSGGEQQRVAIARSLANHPKVILADEPTGNLDTETGKMIFDLLHKLAKSENATILVVTHDLSIAGRTDMTFKLKDGRLEDARQKA
ncbi:MAG TPA: ABC transporter ATP-binding protein [Candidatus Saccharimonadales bacterium]|nr:ABC transporter ATP-binding protein [Candidatus Saccharimonadales bacterium]